MIRGTLPLLVFASVGVARADQPDVATPSPTATLTASAGAADTANSRPHAVYIEIFGKGGLYGLGYDYRFTRRLGAGAAAAAYVINDQRVLSLSPYVSAYPVLRGRHAVFAHAGPQIVDMKVISPVPQWPGERSTAIGGQVSAGYEHTGRVLVRAYVMLVAGSGGVAPWAGVSVGASL